MPRIAVIDTETNWNNEVMSLGVVTADPEEFCPLASRYYVLTPQWEIGGMYDGVLDLAPTEKTVYGTRSAVMENLNRWLKEQGTERIFAYNARFDCRLLPELGGFSWYDIMRLAAYRQYNARIPCDAPCCRTGRLKNHYGVEPILRLLSGDCSYRETHNAYFDALDELKIMRYLGQSLDSYDCAGISL